MLLALTLTALFAVAGVMTALSLLDSWLRGKVVYRGLKREKALIDAGFVPQVQAREVRLRRPARRRTLASATRPYSRRTPLPMIEDSQFDAATAAAC